MTHAYSSIRTRGFTLIELLVVLGIGAMLLTVIIFGYRSFQDRLSVSAASQEIALSIRQAQTYAISVKQTSEGDFTQSYGIYFDLKDPGAYYIFVDKNSNGVYDGDSSCAPNGECIEKDIILNNVSITSLCGTTALGAQTCPPPQSSGVNFIFTRPTHDAVINFSNGGTPRNKLPGVYQSSKISLKSAGGVVSTVTVLTTGQVGIQ